MNIILSPEKTNTILKLYHKSNKTLIPFALGSSLCHTYNTNKNVTNTLDTLTISNFAFHSYVSSSCIITDYIKPRTLALSTRGLSLILHTGAVVGYLNKIYKNN